ncbi:prenyltransferase/squalene oxidase repeat-containing protein [Streptomyces uncialis]|uniref:prenyltransferase/squalene oxidase repeat-containing protein n=1 Tax=Streptomyces uncialis TaxID=1048205 RepID=UPI00386EACA1|nr:terpene cyclase/mutase family protein [Streptomyces uncialis]
MNVRRTVTAIAATAVIAAAAAPTAIAAPATTPATPEAPAAPDAPGLHGSTDPTYDGVWRQSLTLLAQDITGVRPAAQAVDWLTAQQCADGAFAAFRADPAAKCGAKTPVDSNSTAAAVQALAALGGEDTAVRDAVRWLRSAQNPDGGWGYLPGGPSDTNSTSLVAGALTAAGTAPDGVRSKDGKNAHDALLKLSVPCDADGGGGFAYQPDKKGVLAANADATAAGVLGGLDRTLVTKAAPAADPATCAEPRTAADTARNGAAHLVTALAAKGYLVSSLAGAKDQPDHGNTADAVVALAAAGLTDRADRTVTWLKRDGAAWAAKSGPAAWSQLVLAAHATGADPRDFGGTDLVQRLNATGPAPESVPDAKDTAAEDGKDTGDNAKDSKDGDGGPAVIWIIGIGLVFGIGIGILLSGRRKKRQK